ncbi:MAG: type II toxin-antitoxin system RatA family toxin [Pseudomonadota bacterium]
MTEIQRSALLPFAAGRLFKLVNDIEAYPQYMDGCVGAEILAREADAVEARLDLARGGIRQSFSTRNRSEGEAAISLELIDGPFEFFEGRWEFEALGDTACKVSLQLRFKASSVLLSAAAGSLFEGVSTNLVDAVCQRAQRLYG